mmetsp:Transcript_3787/g.6467  ORF Transcript_3787/g.6467 Transcript_3787/m.6467 type:complete len:175 (+) Transcript_3787:324-848(+)|eukprot:CAMPEP_0168608806 /NCGR_PEP_ID=MMETSP0449_2-20121227/850_1 /TAXON_ID=1082188 /ORGANISM="Strombidium rassoulzadegani, Strain ras09" /LENGTH=174 /DNA_ID=CAMNT_0008648869 /DNA_START=201 /DNA_END=725 /DNA_ORIENTATION=+
MYRDDVLYYDKTIERYSTTKRSKGYLEFSEMFKIDPAFQGLKFDKKDRLRSDTHEQVNFKRLRDAFLSKDLRKFEELKQEPLRILTEVFQFLLGVDPLEGTYAEHRIKEVVGMGSKVTEVYKLKTATHKLNKIDRFAPELQEHVKSEIYDFCQFFGYFEQEGSDVPFQFFPKPA